MLAARSVLLITAGVAAVATSACASTTTQDSAGTASRAAASSAQAQAGTSAAGVKPVSKAGPESGGKTVTVPAQALGEPVNWQLGGIISTGLDASKTTEWVIYGAPVNSNYSPKSTFGFQLSERQNNGRLDKAVEISEVKGSPLAPGFHAVEHSYELEGDVQQPAFGYFVGDVAKITGTVSGRTVSAKTATWNAQRSVTVFWFDNTEVTGNDRLDNVSAFDPGNEQIARTTVNY